MRSFFTFVAALLLVSPTLGAPSLPLKFIGLAGTANHSLVVPRQCVLPDTNGKFETATAAEVNVDQAAVDKAIQLYSKNGTISIKVFRNNCLIGASELEEFTDPFRKNIFSATKGVISMLTGIALDQGKLQLDDAIDKYLPPGPGWGDPAHRAITIRQLLTETAGTAKGVIPESATVLWDPSLPQEALAQPLIFPPGEVYQYAQRVPDLLAYIVARAVGHDLQLFAQAYLFGPIGIPPGSYIWLRDRSGNTYGYAWLYLSASSFARLGLLMQNSGFWRDQRIISEDYVNQVSVPSSTNGCYGLLFWTNRGDTCISPSGFHFHRTWMPSAPRDLFAMSGAPTQKNYMIPSLNITVSWLGVLEDKNPAADLWYLFFKALMPGVRDMTHVKAGPYQLEPTNVTYTDAMKASDLAVLMAGVNSSPQCNILVCNGEIPMIGFFQNIASLFNLTFYSITAILGW